MWQFSEIFKNENDARDMVWSSDSIQDKLKIWSDDKLHIEFWHEDKKAKTMVIVLPL